MLHTLLDIAKANGNDQVVGLIDEASRAHPEVTGMGPTGEIAPGITAGRTIKGLNYKTRVRTALPSVGFRNANEGSTQAKAAYEQRLVECYLMNPIWQCDRAVADAYEFGGEAYITEDANAQMEAALATLAKQFYYGVAADAKGFPGLIDAYSTELEVDAGGTTASTGSSLWAVKFGVQDVAWIFGDGGKLDLSELQKVVLYDDNGKPFDGYSQSLLARPGLQVGNKYSVGRIRDLTEDSGKGLTDTLISQLLAKFPVGRRPDAFFCSRRSLEQLRVSRINASLTGAWQAAPTEVDGIPIVATDSILNTEALSA